jgi:DeoR family transcriptional regulator, aga operon transcriptional repressor
MTALSNLSNIERQEQLLRFVVKEQRISVDQICEEFSVSQATARRDLVILAESGKVRRIHGGALAMENAPPEPPVALRSTEQSEEKKRIGKATAQLIGDGSTIFMSSGTTVLEVANNLRNHQGLTVITNSLLIMNTLADVAEIMLVSIGGILRSSELSFIGHITEQALTEIRVDKVILGIRAIDVEVGLTNDYLPETQTDRAIVGIGQKVVLVADHTKCGRTSTTFVAPISNVDTFVTDNKTPQDFVTALVDQGIKVITT